MISISPQYQPELDPDFVPASLWIREFERHLEDPPGRECAVEIEGEVVFSGEAPLDPYFQKNPNHHREGISNSPKCFL